MVEKTADIQQTTEGAVGRWGKLELLAPDFSPLDPLLEFIDQLKEVLTILSNLMDTLLTFLTGLTDPLTIILQKLIEKLKEMVEALIVDLGVYAIMIPNGKRFQTTFMGLGDITPPNSTHMFPEQPDLNDPDIPADEHEFLTRMNRYNGGNAAFYRMVLDSLHDKGDANRPQFTGQDVWVTGIVLVMGTDNDPFGFLDGLWSLKGLFGSLFESTYVTTIPTAKGLTAEALTRPGDSGKFSVLLKWDTMDTPFSRIADLGNTVLVPERQAIIMIKNRISAVSATNVVQLLATRDITGETVSPDGTATVIYENVFDFSKVSHVHEVTDAHPDDVYCFAVAYKNRIWRTDENWTVDKGHALGYWDTSNIARVVPFPVLPGSTPPDWYRTPSVGDLFPDLAYFLRQLMVYIDNFASRLLSVQDLWKKYVAFLREEIDRYERLINNILDKIKKLTAMLKLPDIGVYGRIFKGQGGNQFFLSDLAKSLTHSFPDAPPFHRGDEFVSGVVLMAGGDLDSVNKFEDIIKLIFNLEPPQFDDLIDSIGDAVSELEATCFGDSLSPQTCTTAEEQLDENLEEKLVVCQPVESPTTLFGPDLEPLP